MQVFSPFVLTAVHAQQIITDGRTQTTLSITGNTTDVSTGTVFGNTGVN